MLEWWKLVAWNKGRGVLNFWLMKKCLIWEISFVTFRARVLIFDESELAELHKKHVVAAWNLGTNYDLFKDR